MRLLRLYSPIEFQKRWTFRPWSTITRSTNFLARHLLKNRLSFEVSSKIRFRYSHKHPSIKLSISYPKLIPTDILRSKNLRKFIKVAKFFLNPSKIFQVKFKHFPPSKTSTSFHEQPTLVQGDAHLNCLNNVWRHIVPKSGKRLFDPIINA